jgi:hypothetical protein
MSFLRPIQWYHSHVDPIWPDGTFKNLDSRFFHILQTEKRFLEQNIIGTRIRTSSSQVFVCLRMVSFPIPLLANIVKTSTCHTERRLD